VIFLQDLGESWANPVKKTLFLPITFFTICFDFYLEVKSKRVKIFTFGDIFSHGELLNMLFS